MLVRASAVEVLVEPQPVAAGFTSHRDGPEQRYRDGEPGVARGGPDGAASPLARRNAGDDAGESNETAASIHSLMVARRRAAASPLAASARTERKQVRGCHRMCALPVVLQDGKSPGR